MTIINIEDYREPTRETASEPLSPTLPPLGESLYDRIKSFNSQEKKSWLLSSLSARLLFLCLLGLDLLWSIYSMIFFSVKLALCTVTLFRNKWLQASLSHSWLSLKRSVICFIGLVVALFVPGLGVMFGCLYFLMYDKKGIEEIVPSALRTQFADLFPA